MSSPTRPTSRIRAALWRYLLTTALLAVVTTWAGMLVPAILEAQSCGGRYRSCTGTQTAHIYGVIASVFSFFVMLPLTWRLRSPSRESGTTERPFMLIGYQTHRIIPAGAWLFVCAYTVITIRSEQPSVARTAITLGLLGLLFVIVAVDLGVGLMRRHISRPRDLFSGDVLLDAVDGGTRRDSPVGPADDEILRIHRTERSLSRFLATSNTVGALGGLAVGFSAYVFLFVR